MSESRCQSWPSQRQRSWKGIAAADPLAARRFRTATSEIGRLETLYEFGRIDIQSGRQFQNVVQCQIASSPLDLTNESPVEATVVRELLLALAELVPPGPDTDAELFGGGRKGRGRHEDPNHTRPKP